MVLLSNTDEHALLDVLFLKAIKQRLEGDNETREHIYLKQFEIPQIVLFDILIRKMPFVVYGHKIVNEEIAEILQGVRKAVLMDVGIGRGLQVMNLIKLLKKNICLKELTIIGVEPSGEALQVASETISKIAGEVPFKIIFNSVEGMAEEANEARLQHLIPQQYETFIVNSAFTLHHIQQREKRQDFFQLLKKINADHVFLLEPYSDHYTNDWKQRVLNAYHHYGTVFNVIDQLDVSAEERKGLKVFFGREIDDVAGFADSQHYERHEEGQQWVEYLRQAHFNISSFQNVPGNIDKPAIDFVQDEKGYLKMEHDGLTILSIIKAEKDHL